MGDWSTQGTYIKQGPAGATPPGREPRGACPPQGEYGCSAPRRSPAQALIRVRSWAGAVSGLGTPGEATVAPHRAAQRRPELLLGARPPPGLPPCALPATSWMFGPEILAYLGARFSVAGVPSFRQDLEGVHDAPKGEKGRFFLCIETAPFLRPGGHARVDPSTRWDRPRSGQLWRAPPPRPGGGKGFPVAAPGTGSSGGLDAGGAQGCFVTSAKLPAELALKRLRGSRFRRALARAIVPGSRSAMPAPVLLEGPASSDSPRSLVTRRASGARARAEAEALSGSSGLAADPTDPRPRSRSQVELSSTRDGIPALSLKSC